MPTTTTKLNRLFDTRHLARNRQIVAVQVGIRRWITEIGKRITGELGSYRVDPESTLRSVAAVTTNVPDEAVDVMARSLRKIWDWGWESATKAWIQAVPLQTWIDRRPPPLQPREAIDVEDAFAAVIDGRITGEAAREVVREISFPPPTKEYVDGVLNARCPADGKTAMERIKTVSQRELATLQDRLSSGISRGDSLDTLNKEVREFVGNVNYKAARIVRTEGMRIAEASQRATFEEAEDLLDGIEARNSEDANVRAKHQWWNRVIFRKGEDGVYRDDQGRDLPVFPADPNCRCWTMPVLIGNAI